MNLFDSSALLVMVKDEPGADLVERELLPGSLVSAVNWSEVAQKIASTGASWPLARALLLSHGLAVEPVLAVDAERAAELWERAGSLSVADRLCLATGERLSATVWTADRAWGSSAQVRQVR